MWGLGPLLSPAPATVGSPRPQGSRSYRRLTARLFNAEMLALASTRLGNGLTSLAFAVITVGAFVVLSRIKRLAAHRAGLKHLQLLAFVLGIIALLTIPVAMESFFRIWDPSYVYDGS
jgi:hypothetical protein